MFNLTQIDALTLSKIRESEFYDFVRKSLNIPVGEFFSLEDAMELYECGYHIPSLKKTKKGYSVFPASFYELAGFDFSVTSHALKVGMLLLNLKLSLRDLHQGKGSFIDVKTAKKSLLSELLNIEW